MPEKKLQTLKGVNINFNIRQTTPANKPTGLHCIIRYNSNRIVISNLEKVEPRNWNSKTQKVRANLLNEKGENINEKLRDSKTAFEDIFNNYKKEHKAYPDPLTFRELCMKALLKEVTINPGAEEIPADLISFAKLFIQDTTTGKRLNIDTGKPIGKATITVYNTVTKTLEEFKKLQDYDLTLNNITLEFYEDFTDYLKFTKTFSTNTIGKYIKTIKIILREAKERGISTTEHFKSKRFKVLSEATDTIYLNEKELESISNLDLSANTRLERVRDLFLVGCYTGLRFSDYNDIQPKNITGDFIKIKAIKTGQEVVIPIHDRVKEIMKRYADKTENSLPPAISNPKMNEYIKEVGKLAEITELISTEFTKAGKKVTKHLPKHQLITTHTARRSFATNMYLMGIPTLTIMAITGHKTETSFMKYIKVTPEEHATSMLNLWNRKSLKIVV